MYHEAWNSRHYRDMIAYTTKLIHWTEQWRKKRQCFSVSYLQKTDISIHNTQVNNENQKGHKQTNKQTKKQTNKQTNKQKHGWISVFDVINNWILSTSPRSDTFAISPGTKVSWIDGVAARNHGQTGHWPCKSGIDLTLWLPLNDAMGRTKWMIDWLIHWLIDWLTECMF